MFISKTSNNVYEIRKWLLGRILIFPSEDTTGFGHLNIFKVWWKKSVTFSPVFIARTFCVPTLIKFIHVPIYLFIHILFIELNLFIKSSKTYLFPSNRPWPYYFSHCLDFIMIWLYDLFKSERMKPNCILYLYSGLSGCHLYLQYFKICECQSTSQHQPSKVISKNKTV